MDNSNNDNKKIKCIKKKLAYATNNAAKGAKNLARNQLDAQRRQGKHQTE